MTTFLTDAQLRLAKKIAANTVYDEDVTGHGRRSLRVLKRRGVVSSNSGLLSVDSNRLSDLSPINWDSVPRPALTTLSFSGGKQSSCLLWMVLLGEIEVDKDTFVVLNADPGMENSGTYEYIDMMFEECEKAGIYYKTVDGGNLYEDLINMTEDDKRIDNPPYWTKNSDGTRGRLLQKCTREYKIRPMNREIRGILERRYDIGQGHKKGLPENLVEQWIGFSYDEVTRIKPSDRKFVSFRYPLVELGMTDEDVVAFFNDNSLPIPPRSVCNACFSNGLRSFYEAYRDRPQDWQQIVNVDKSVRNMSNQHIEEEVYVSSTLVPITQLGEEFEELGDDATDGELNAIVSGEEGESDNKDDYSCDSGYCFI